MRKKLVLFTQAVLFTVVTIGINVAPAAYAAIDDASQAATTEAVQYIADQQQADGSIAGYGGETDWAVIAVTATGTDPATIQTADGVSLTDALASSPLDSTDSATSVERRMLAVAALGEDTANYEGVNYNSLLSAQVNANQVGDTTLLNDDMFAVMAADVSNDTALIPVAQQALDYVLSNQDATGGFSWATPDNAWYSGPDSNNTAAAIVAMQSAKSMNISSPQLEPALSNATNYLLGLQDTNGGFLYDTNAWTTTPDVGSTAWALIALNTFGDTYASAISSARNWLLSQQSADGGFGYAPGFSDTMTTPQVILALRGTAWTLASYGVEISGQAAGQSNDGSADAGATTTVASTTTAQDSSNSPRILPAVIAAAIVRSAAAPKQDKHEVKSATVAAVDPVAQPSHVLRAAGIVFIVMAGLGTAAFVLLPKFKR